MILSYAKGPLNKKTITIANYMDVMFVDFKKSDFLVRNNQIVIIFLDRTNTKNNYLNVDLKEKVLECWTFKDIHVDFNNFENFEEFKFESLKDFKSIILKKYFGIVM